MQRGVVFWTAFNSYRSAKLARPGQPHPVTTAAWTAGRAALFLRFTLPSVMAQDIDAWVFVVLLDAELRALSERYLPPLEDDRIVYCYDDADGIERAARFDEVVLALIDADDLYAPSAARLMLECRAEWMYFRHGYALDIPTRRILRYDTIGTGPFFGRRMAVKELVAFDRDKRHPTHKAVAERHPVMLPPGQFCVTLHGLNTSSNARMRYVGRPLRQREVPLWLKNLV